VDPHGSALAKLRVDADLSILAAAADLEVAEDQLSDIERGTVSAPTWLLANMARVYRASPHVVVKAYLADRRG